jgi:hypothetical protein
MSKGRWFVFLIFVLVWGTTAVVYGKPTGPFDCAGVVEIPQTECSALVSLYNSTNGADWSGSTDWLVTNTPCSWFGVDCSSGHVSGLDLDNNNLNGPLPTELGNLTNLTVLDLDGNQLSGPLPPFLGNLNNLIILDLSNNNFAGPVPQNFINLTLTVFAFDATNLCEPDNMPFQDWLDGIANLDSTGVICSEPFVGINFKTGAPDIFFTLTAAIFPANTNASISVNGQQLGAVPTGADGSFTFLFSTTNADEGFYSVKVVAAGETAFTSFTLAAKYPLRPQDGTGSIFNIPAGIALTEFVYLPFIQKE